MFCAQLRDALKVELQRGQMKLVKGFVKGCYSEALVLSSSAVADNEHEDGSLITEEKDGSLPRETTYHGGLGLRFKFPGDVHVLGTFEHLAVHDVGDDGLVLAAKVFVEQLDQLFAVDGCFCHWSCSVAREARRLAHGNLTEGPTPGTGAKSVPP